MKVYLAADIGGTFTKYGIFNEEGKLLHNWKAPTDIKDTDEIPENISNELMNLVKKHNYKSIRSRSWYYRFPKQRRNNYSFR